MKPIPNHPRPRVNGFWSASATLALMGTVRIRYWAGAKAAAGTALEEVVADTPRLALEQARRDRGDPGFDRVLAASSLLIDGRAAHDEDLDRPVDAVVELEVLPPFAGG